MITPAQAHIILPAARDSGVMPFRQSKQRKTELPPPSPPCYDTNIMISRIKRRERPRGQTRKRCI